MTKKWEVKEMESLEEKKWEGHGYSEEAVVYTGQNTHDVDDIQARAYGVSRGNWFDSCLGATNSRIYMATKRANVISGHIHSSRV